MIIVSASWACGPNPRPHRGDAVLKTAQLAIDGAVPSRCRRNNAGRGRRAVFARAAVHKYLSLAMTLARRTGIKAAIKMQYRNCISVDAIIEILSKLLEPEELA
jgi:hypothetical protein